MKTLMKKGNLYLFLFMCLVIVPLATWTKSRAIKAGKKAFREFNFATITARVKSIKIASRGVGLQLEDGREFIFYPYTNEQLNGLHIFYDTAEKGDSVFKKAFGDTLYLIQGNKTFAYTFQKF